MADKAPRPKSGDPNKVFLFAGLACILLGIALTAYEVLRPQTDDEIKRAKEDKKLQDDIDRENKRKKGP